MKEIKKNSKLCLWELLWFHFTTVPKPKLDKVPVPARTGLRFWNGKKLRFQVPFYNTAFFSLDLDPGPERPNLFLSVHKRFLLHLIFNNALKTRKGSFQFSSASPWKWSSQNWMKLDTPIQSHEDPQIPKFEDSVTSGYGAVRSWPFATFGPKTNLKIAVTFLFLKIFN